MTTQTFHTLVQIAGAVQLGMMVLGIVASKITGKLEVVHILPPIHRQMYLAYTGYIIATICALGLFCLLYPDEITSGNGLGRGVAIFGTLFWGGRLLLQFRYDIQPYLRKRWMRLGYYGLTPVFLGLVVVYVIAAV